MSSNWRMNNVWILYPTLELLLLQFPAMREGLDTTDYAWWIILCQKCVVRLHIIWCADQTRTISPGERLLYNIFRRVLNMQRWSLLSNLSKMKWFHVYFGFIRMDCCKTSVISLLLDRMAHMVWLLIRIQNYLYPGRVPLYWFTSYNCKSRRSPLEVDGI